MTSVLADSPPDAVPILLVEAAAWPALAERLPGVGGAFAQAADLGPKPSRPEAREAPTARHLFDRLGERAARA